MAYEPARASGLGAACPHLDLAACEVGIWGRRCDWARVLREDGPLPPARAVELMIGILDALAHAHAAGVVHRDLSARNVFVRGTGHLSLPIDRRVVHEIATTLAQLESDGSTITRCRSSS